MRKLLLAATAVVGAMGLASAAHAQAAKSGYILGPDPTIFGPTSSVPGPSGLPGSIQVYFRGRLHTDWMVGGDSLDKSGGNKSGNIMFGEYARFYTGFEGTAANGLKFGAFLEMRQNSSPNLGASTGTATVIWRREVGYLKGNWGQVRFGQTDGASGLFQTGNFENFDDGGWNGDLPGVFNGNASLDWPFPENSGTYGTGKIVYLSPQFSGFDFGVDYEPNFNASGEANCGSAAAGVGGGCPRLSSFVGAPGQQFRRNTFDVTGRYQGTLGPVAVTAMLGVMTAGHVHNSTQGASNPTTMQFGATIAYQGWAFGGDVIGGNSNGTGYAALVPVGDGGARELGFVVGTSYAWGPFIVGASYLSYHSQGAYVNTAGQAGAAANAQYSSRSQAGVAVGGTYAWAPGTAAFLSFLWGQRHQVGYNFMTGTPGLDHNNTTAVGALIGNTFNW